MNALKQATWTRRFRVTYCPQYSVARGDIWNGMSCNPSLAKSRQKAEAIITTHEGLFMDTLLLLC